MATLKLDFISCRQSVDITYLRLIFYSPRPESFFISKKTAADGPWIPYQYYRGIEVKYYGHMRRTPKEIVLKDVVLESAIEGEKDCNGKTELNRLWKVVDVETA
nr:unnamed protein product [Callosobruchus analis]